MREPILTKHRQVQHCPPHFTKVTIIPEQKERRTLGSVFSSLDTNRLNTEAAVRNWLHENVDGRFFIGRHCNLERHVFVEALIAAFENPQDATYFSLVLPSLIVD